MDCDSPCDPLQIRNAASAGLSQVDYWQQAPPMEFDSMHRGAQYLAMLRDLAVQPRWISLTHIADPPGAALGWIGQHIHAVNQRLYAILQDMLDCFEPAQRPPVQIFAAPIDPQAGVDGFYNDGPNLGACSLPQGNGAVTITLMVDPGRIVPADWPGLVAHELAHGVARSPGHGAEFAQAIAHLCLAQDLPLPPPALGVDELRFWPPCRRCPRPEAFWLRPWPQPDWP